MVSRTRKTVLVYSMLLVATICHESAAQQQFQKAAVPVQSPVYQNPGFTGIAAPGLKGYYNPQVAGSYGYYNTHPINGGYWMGQHPQAYPHYQYPQYSPYPYQYNAQPYGYGHPGLGYAQSYGRYPNFDPAYWSMARGHPYYQYPGQQMYYPGQQMYQQPGQMYYAGRGYMPGSPYMYPGHYNPYYKKPLFGQNGHKIVKGILGAALVGVIAGKVARG